MKIRKAQISDLKEIDEIYREGVLDEEKPNLLKKTKKEISIDLNNSKKERLCRFREAIFSSKESFLICEEDMKIIGFGGASLSSKKRNAEITLIYVRKECRQGGVGKKILNELMKWLQEKGESKVNVTMDITNNASINLHKQAGFEKAIIIMQKRLKN